MGELFFLAVLCIPYLLLALAIMGIDILGQKIFKVPEGYGYVSFVIILFWGVGPIIGLILILQGKIEGFEAFISAIVYAAMLKFVWWDTWIGEIKRKKQEVADKASVPAVSAQTTPAVEPQKIQTAPPKPNRWVYNIATRVLTNRVTGERYKDDQFKWVAGNPQGFEIQHGKTSWVNSYETDFESTVIDIPKSDLPINSETKKPIIDALANKNQGQHGTQVDTVGFPENPEQPAAETNIHEAKVESTNRKKPPSTKVKSKDSLFELGQNYETGIGVVKNHNLAMYYYSRAALGGSRKAYERLGISDKTVKFDHYFLKIMADNWLNKVDIKDRPKGI